MESAFNPTAYIPKDAKINEKTEDLPPPTTRYQERCVVLPREKVQEITGIKDVK